MDGWMEGLSFLSHFLAQRISSLGYFFLEQPVMGDYESSSAKKLGFYPNKAQKAKPEQTNKKKHNTNKTY